jgi:hypothetical protein
MLALHPSSRTAQSQACTRQHDVIKHTSSRDFHEPDTYYSLALHPAASLVRTCGWQQDQAVRSAPQ